MTGGNWASRISYREPVVSERELSAGIAKVAALRAKYDGVRIRGDRRLAWAHAPGCDCKPEDTFTCDRCGRRFGNCLGCHDSMPGSCDSCWGDAPGWAIRWRDHHGLIAEYIAQGGGWTSSAPYQFFEKRWAAISFAREHWGAGACLAGAVGIPSMPVIVGVKRRDSIVGSAGWVREVRAMWQRRDGRGGAR